jgi:Holliday junction resolvase
MRRAAVDANQSEIVAALRKAGCSVTPTHQAGKGFPDLAVGHRGKTYLIEVKDGEKPPSRQKLTDDQVRWHGQWLGHKAVVCNVSEALEAVGINAGGLA